MSPRAHCRPVQSSQGILPQNTQRQVSSLPQLDAPHGTPLGLGTYSCRLHVVYKSRQQSTLILHISSHLVVTELSLGSQATYNPSSPGYCTYPAHCHVDFHHHKARHSVFYPDRRQRPTKHAKERKEVQTATQILVSVSTDAMVTNRPGNSINRHWYYS
jgi:hypothetical protein